MQKEEKKKIAYYFQPLTQAINIFSYSLSLALSKNTTITIYTYMY